MMEGPPNKTRIGSPADFFFDDNTFDSLLGIQSSNGLSNTVHQLDVGLSMHQGHQHTNGLQQPNDSIMRSAQQMSLSQLLSADSTTSRVHVTDTISMAASQNSSTNVPNVYNNIRPPFGGSLTNNVEPFMRDMAALNRTSMTPMQTNNAMSSPMNGQHRFNLGGQQANGALPLHLQGQNNMPHGPALVNGMANMQSLRHSAPLNGNLSNVPAGLLPPNHMQQTQQQLQNSQLAAHLNAPHNQPPTSDPEKRKLIQQQLVLLLHAHKCQRKQNGAKTCSLPHCQTMKNVLHHMTTCIAGKNCTVPHCSSSRQIIVHWKNCNRQECPVCCPLRNASDRRNMMGQQNLMLGDADLPPPKEVMAKAYEALGMSRPGSEQMAPASATPSLAAILSPPPVFSGPPSVASTNGDVARGGSLGGPSSIGPLSVGSNNDGLGFAGSDLITPAPVKTTKEWHVKITNDLRNHLVHKLVQAIFPTSDPAALRDSRMQNLIQYARRVESEMFESADSQESYYHLLAEKIYKIQKELDEKQQRKRLETQAAAGGVQPNSSPAAQRRPLLNGQMGHASNAIRSLDAALGVEGASAPPSVDFSRLRSPDMAPSPANSDLSQLSSSTLFRAKQQLDILQHKQQSAERPNSLPDVVSSAGAGLFSPLHHSMSALPLATGKPGLMTPPLLSEELRQMRGAHGGSDGQFAVNGKSSMFNDEKPSINEREAIDIAVQRGKDVWRSTAESGEALIKTEVKEENVDFDSELTAPASVKMEEKPVTDGSGVKTEDGSKTSAGGAAAVVKLECKHTPGKKVWTTEELCASLMSTWDQMYKQEPEAAPFREPVDAELLGLVDYHDIIKRPMDLSTIRRKLEEGEYRDPWAYIDDVWLMLDNAWLYNRKMTKVYKFCSKLAEVFEEAIHPVMLSLGYCCGKRYVFDPQALCCMGKQLCTIPRDATYYSYEDKYVYCEKCFQDFKTDEIEVCEDPTQPPVKLKKEVFNKCKNNVIEPEGFVNCLGCGRKMHQICVLHMKEIWPRGFTCDNCLRASGEKRRENKYTAKRLPSTKLGSYLENRVNNFLKKKDCGAGDVTIRVLNTADKVVEVKPGIRRRFANELPSSFPYRAKAMFAFEEVDGVDICFFGMHVQEYGSDVAPPNTRRVYIAYLDSVHFFQPKDFRTAVYHEILVGYLDYVKGLGYNLAHIWACPPSEGDDYIFHCHPPEQKIPKPKRLQDWYRKMLDKAIMEGVVFEYKDVLKDALDNNVQSVAEMPYFEGDFWPNVIEESIKELDREEAEKRLREEAEAAATEADDFDTDSVDLTESINGKKKGQKGNMKRKNKSAVRKNNKRSGLPNNGCDLNSKIFATMEKHKEVFFVIRLNPPSTALPNIQDPDPVIHCDLMDGRDTFLTMAREKHHEFSSLRRVKFSSMAMLYELHVQNNSLSYTCNSCRKQIETRWHCSKCEDFDLCVLCYPKVKHEHHMDKIDLGLDEDKPSADPREARRQSIQRFIQFLEHACQCRDANCRMPSCRKMKTTMQHKNACRRPNCQICSQVNNLLLFHARDCKETKCLVPFCQQIQQKLKQREQQQRVRNEKLMRRRMQHMHALNAVHTPLSNGGAGGGSSSRDGGGGGGNGKGGEIGYLSPSPFSSNSKPQQQPVPSKALEAAQQAQLMAQMSSSAAGKFGAAQRMSVPSSLSIGGPRPGMMDMQHSPLHPQQSLASSPMGGGPRWQSPIGQQQQQASMSNHMADAQQHMAMRMGSPFGPQGGGAVGGAMGMQPQQQGSAMNNPEMQKVLQMMRTSGQDEVAQKLRENPELLATFIKMRHESSGPRHQLPPNNGGVPMQPPQQQQPFSGGMVQMNSMGGPQQQQQQDRMGPLFHQQQQANNMIGQQQGIPMSQQEGQVHGQGQGQMQHFAGVMPGQQVLPQPSDGLPMQQQPQPDSMAQFSSHQQQQHQQQQQQAQWMQQQQMQQQQMRQQQMRQQMMVSGTPGQPPPYGMNQPMARMMVMGGGGDHSQPGAVGSGNMQFLPPQQQQQMFIQQQQQQQHATQMRMMGVHSGGPGAMNAMMMQQSAMNAGVGAGPMSMQMQQIRASSQQQLAVGMRLQGGQQRMTLNPMMGAGGGVGQQQQAAMMSQGHHPHHHAIGGMGMAGGPPLMAGLPGDDLVDPQQQQQQQVLGGMQQRLIDLNSFSSEDFF